MWTKLRGEDAFISVEAVISIFFLVVLTFFSLQMLRRQESIIINANHQVEATGALFDIRQALRGTSCSENFSGLNLSTAEGVIKGIKTESQEGERVISNYPVGEMIKLSPSELIIDSYALTPLDESNHQREGITYLKVTFSGKKGNERLVKKIKLFIKLGQNQISECSLNPFGEYFYFWNDNGHSLTSNLKFFQINSHKTVGTLNLQGGLIVYPTVINCNSSQWGTLYWSETANKWMICGRDKFLEVDDSRVFTGQGLTKMVNK